MLTKPNARLLLIITLLVGVVLLSALWRQRSDLAQLKHDYRRLAEQNQALQQALQQSRAAIERMAPAAPAAPTTGFTTAHPPPPAAAPNQLLWGGAEVQPIPGGLLATLQFNPTQTSPLGEVYVAVQLPNNSPVKILDLTPQGATVFAHSGKRVLRDGKFAIFQGTPNAGSAIRLGLSVSGPATVDVRGTSGITPFKLDIAPTGATVRSN
jgi:hypothetical protein